MKEMLEEIWYGVLLALCLGVFFGAAVAFANLIFYGLVEGITQEVQCNLNQND